MLHLWFNSENWPVLLSIKICVCVYRSIESSSGAISGTATGFLIFFKNVHQRSRVDQEQELFNFDKFILIWMDFLEHRPDLDISRAFLHMKVTKTLGNVDNIPVAHVLAFYGSEQFFFTHWFFFFVACKCTNMPVGRKNTCKVLWETLLAWTHTLMQLHWVELILYAQNNGIFLCNGLKHEWICMVGFGNSLEWSVHVGTNKIDIWLA